MPLALVLYHSEKPAEAGLCRLLGLSQSANRQDVEFDGAKLAQERVKGRILRAEGTKRLVLPERTPSAQLQIVDWIESNLLDRMFDLRRKRRGPCQCLLPSGDASDL